MVCREKGGFAVVWDLVFGCLLGWVGCFRLPRGMSNCLCVRERDEDLLSLDSLGMVLFCACWSLKLGGETLDVCGLFVGILGRE